MSDSVCALGAADRLVGRTAFCVHPRDQLEHVRVVGGTKTPNLRKIAEQVPDLVLMNAEENRLEHVEAIERFAPVFVALPRTVAHAIADVRTIGRLLADPVRGERLARELAVSLGVLESTTRDYSYAYLIWREPYMTINDDTFISDLLGAGGGVNVFGRRPERYPTITLEAVLAAEPDLILLPDEPYEFRSEHAEELLARVPESPHRAPAVELVRGDLLAWHGARLREGIPYSEQVARAATGRDGGR